MTTNRRLAATLLMPALALGSLAACGSDDGAAGTASAGQLSVVTSFYPLQYVSERVAGDLAQVSNLTKPGAEPHDLELTPREVADVSKADLVVYLKDFQPSVDEAVTSQAADRSFDVSTAADLSLAGHEEEEGHEGETAEEHAEHDHGTQDPHFWLDPQRLEKVTTAVGEKFAATDPDHAATYRDNAKALVADLTTLDGEFTTGLKTCTNRDVVTSHEAFGYLAQRYDLTQVGITGLTPEAEPDAATLASVAKFVRDNKVGTIYYETLVSPRIAETVAAETGARTAVLDPIEGLSDSSAGDDYLAVMRANLATLETGQNCT